MHKKVRDLKKGETIILADGQSATVTSIETGDRSPFGRIKGVRFAQPNPMTIHFKDSGGEKGYAIAGAASEVEVGE